MAQLHCQQELSSEGRVPSHLQEKQTLCLPFWEAQGKSSPPKSCVQTSQKHFGPKKVSLDPRMSAPGLPLVGMGQRLSRPRGTQPAGYTLQETRVPLYCKCKTPVLQESHFLRILWERGSLSLICHWAVSWADARSLYVFFIVIPLTAVHGTDAHSPEYLDSNVP